MLTRAIEIATRAHDGQVDKAGEPYILHPLTLMLGMKTESERIAAVLHDVVEDTDITLEDLRKEGFSEEVVHAVDLLTRESGEKYWDYLDELSADRIALKVKMEDLSHNMDLSRLPKITEKDLKRRERYREYYAYLKGKQRRV